MIHLYLMLIIVAHTFWLCAFVIYQTCAESNAAWDAYHKPYQFTNRKSNINVIRSHN